MSKAAILPASAQKVAEAAAALGLNVNVTEMTGSTRTAEDAAQACGCDVGQIVKSLVFQGADSGAAYLLLVSGSNRVDEAKTAAIIGEPLKRPDAAFVRAATGYAIGGIPPLGHATALPVFMDEDLLRYDVVWAAAGTPRAIFAVHPARLQAATAASVIAIA
jgi:prolyl-tRNA editing enzyme YbaK/EbsC (Cys-tRNA(Pro) deacylase)